MNSQHLTFLTGSRICHDLISPVGAIANGLELVGMEGGGGGQEMALIGDSVAHAEARIRLFRIAFGAAGNEEVSAAEAAALLQGYAAGTRISARYGLSQAVTRSELRLGLLAFLCAERALPFGGRISLALTECARWRVTAEAERLRIDDQLWEDLAAGRPCAEPTPATVQFALIVHVARDAGRIPAVHHVAGTELELQI